MPLENRPRGLERHDQIQAHRQSKTPVRIPLKAWVYGQIYAIVSSLVQ